MCGIAGSLESLSINTIEKIEKDLYSRGPDDYGRYTSDSITMLMRRLSIIDIENGNQPFISKDGAVVVFQNGEIYNYKELQKVLKGRNYTFRSNSDTEVLLYGYMEWGLPKLLQYVDGMYSIAILDKRRKTLYLIRDRFGEKPLYYTKNHKNFAYTSNLRAFKHLPWINLEIDPLSLHYYLTLHYVPNQYTIFKEVYKVLPGTYLEVDLETCEIRTETYYKLNTSMELVDAQKAEKRFIEEFRNVVQLRMMADVPVGIFLSGGLDSSIITALATQVNSNVSTFSMGFSKEEYDESSYADTVAKHLKTNHHTFMFDETAFIALVPKVARSLDEPIGDQALLPTYFLAEKAREHVKVVLTGEGGDEIFGGYSYYSRCLVPSKSNISSMLRNKEGYTPSRFPLVATTRLADILLKNPKKEKKRDEYVIKLLKTCKDSLQQACMCDLLTWLPDDLLVKLDRMTMAHSLEGRAPFLSPLIAEFGLNLPLSQKVTQLESKIFLKRIAKLLNLPEAAYNRRKQGFILPMKSWITQWFSNKDIKEYISTADFPYLSKPHLIMLIQSEVLGKIKNERLLFSLIMLFEWYKSFRGEEL